jgi:pimeloyl-ACP methyl ester carboxylesterase
VETGQLEVRGFKISYEVFGNPQAPPILLLPSWQIIHSRHWKMQVPYLARFFRVVTYDSPGNGGGERTTDPAGIGGGIVLMDYSVGHLGPLTVVGVPLLFLANVLGLYLLSVAVVTFRESLRAHRRHAGHSAAVA